MTPNYIAAGGGGSSYSPLAGMLGLGVGPGGPASAGANWVGTALDPQLAQEAQAGAQIKAAQEQAGATVKAAGLGAEAQKYGAHESSQAQIQAAQAQRAAQEYAANQQLAGITSQLGYKQNVFNQVFPKLLSFIGSSGNSGNYGFGTGQIPPQYNSGPYGSVRVSTGSVNPLMLAIQGQRILGGGNQQWQP